MGYSKEEVIIAFVEVSNTSSSKDIASLWPAVLCHLKEAEVYGMFLLPYCNGYLLNVFHNEPQLSCISGFE